MPGKPAYPVAGDEITATWGKDVTDFAGEHWRFVRLGWTTVLNAAAGLTASQLVEVTAIPANDPNIVAVHVVGMIRDSAAGVNQTITLADHDATVAAVCYSSGVANRGGQSGPYVVKVGGTNNRQIRWYCNATGTTTCWIYLTGYWVRETPVA